MNQHPKNAPKNWTTEDWHVTKTADAWPGDTYNGCMMAISGNIPGSLLPMPAAGFYWTAITVDGKRWW